MKFINHHIILDNSPPKQKLLLQKGFTFIEEKDYTHLKIFTMRQLFYLLAATFLLSADCHKPDPNPAQYYIKCKIDGQDYLPNNCANCMTIEILGDTVFLMTANAGFQHLGIGIINKPSFLQTSYILSSIQSGGVYKNSTTTTDRFDTDATHTGQLSITTLDKANKIVAGAFYFQAYNPVQNKTVNVSNGEFRIKYTTY